MDKLNEENLDRTIDKLLKDGEISTEEKKILFKYKKNQDKSFDFYLDLVYNKYG